MKRCFFIFFVIFFKALALAQGQPNDCADAIVVCGNGTFMSNASGRGKIQEVSGCSGMEHNSLWMKITIVQDGTLGFDLIPNDPAITVDYDFWVYGPNKTCGNLGSPLRCCTTNPNAAMLANNHTGMMDGLLNTVGGPGPNGNGYVRSLDVKIGETYYIVVDRPEGDGGFQIQWSGTAMSGTGAFPVPPVANQIPDMLTCSLTSNVGVFNLNTVRGQINPDFVNNTVTFHKTLPNAVDGVSPLFPIYSNGTNPETIYARVVNNLSGCYSITSFKLKVFDVASANISLSDDQICQSGEVTATISGPPLMTVEYTVDGGAVQTVVLNESGIFELTETLTANRTYTLVAAKVINEVGVTVCYQPVGQTVMVTVNPLPSVSGQSTVCINESSQLSGSGTASPTSPWISSTETVATVSPTGLVTAVGVGTTEITYTDSNGCSEAVLFTVSALPVITGESVVCEDSSIQLSATGTPAAADAWVSSDASVATVDQGGIVNGVSAGKSTITFTNDAGCSGEFDVEVIASDSILNATAQVSGFFEENQTITVLVEGVDTYMYSLDNGDFQPGNVFYNVSPGVHQVTIQDPYGCSEFILADIYTISYPRFMTPNNDGLNDTWNVSSLSNNQPNAEIRIFDRYGRLLYQTTASGAGWDGSYGGLSLPSDDYWFTIRYVENGVEKVFKAHFSLKR